MAMKKDRCKNGITEYAANENLPKKRIINTDGKIRRKNRKRNADKQKNSGETWLNAIKIKR